MERTSDRVMDDPKKTEDGNPKSTNKDMKRNGAVKRLIAIFDRENKSLNKTGIQKEEHIPERGRHCNEEGGAYEEYQEEIKTLFFYPSAPRNDDNYGKTKPDEEEGKQQDRKDKGSRLPSNIHIVKQAKKHPKNSLDPKKPSQEQQNVYEVKNSGDQKEEDHGIETINTALLQVNERVEKEIKKHTEKISQLKQSLESIRDNNVSEINAVSDKLKELENQMEEFKGRIEELKTKLASSQPSPCLKITIDRILLSVGIECRRLAASLPMYARRKDLLEKIKSNQVSVILGETGSGKSTQLVQYLWEAGLAGNGQIVCTQPRKVAAMTLANRVSTELVQNVGGTVGYKAGFNQKHGKDTKIVFCTDHALLNECLKDPLLSQCSCIIIDEAHERSIYTDILLGMIKSFLPQRPDLKLVITSATINPDVFIKFFNTTEELRVSGRAFPVEIVYEKPDSASPFESYEKKALDKVVEIHTSGQRGDILVFLTSSVEIMRCCEELSKRLPGRTDFLCLPLHGQLQPAEQKKVFEPVREGIRKIVFSTNCAETSITIDGIKFVVDTGVVNEMQYDPKKNMSSLGIRVISQSSADQRKGRAGRTSCGKCYRLYPVQSYESMKTTNQPEILRIHLGQAVLKLAELGVDARKYDFVESPDPASIDSAIGVLQELGAVTLDTAVITDVGRWLSKLPFDPRQSYIVYLGFQKELLYDALALAALINNGANMIYRGFNEAEEQAAARTKSLFGSLYGDLFMWFDIYKTWVKLTSNEQFQWCREKYINHKVLNIVKQTIREVRTTLLKEHGLAIEQTFSENANSGELLRHLIFEANLSFLCHFSGHKRAGYFVAETGQQVYPHPSSTLIDQNHFPEWVIYTQLTKTSRNFIRGLTVVEESWIQQAINAGKLAKSFFKVKELKVEVVCHREVGQSVFYQLVGPRFSRLRLLEQELEESGMQSVVVEANRDLGTFTILSTTPMHETLTVVLQQEINEKVSELRQGVGELPVGHDKSGVRVVLKEGATVTSVLMPNQSNKVCISQAEGTVSEADVRSKFSKFGKVLECVQFKEKKKSWGFVKYASNDEALRAVDGTCEDQDLKASLMLSASKFQAAVTWCRRQIQGNGMAFIRRCGPLERAELVDTAITVQGNRSVIKVSNQNCDDLVVFKTGTASEEEIKEAIFEEVLWMEEQKQKLNVQVLREKVEVDPPEKLNLFKQKLIFAFGEFVSTDKFSIRLLQPKKGSPNYIGFICFDDAVNGFKACQELRSRNFFIGGQKVKINPQLKTSIIIPEPIMKACQEKFYSMKSDFERGSKNTLKFRKLQRGGIAADIIASERDPMIQIRAALQQELEGEVISCAQTTREKALLKKPGLEALRKIEAAIPGVALMPLFRAEQIRLYGSSTAVKAARDHINEFLDKLPERTPEELCLKDPSRPVGLMKVLMMQFLDLREDFIKMFGVDDVSINYKRHVLSVLGSEASRAKVKEYLSSIEATIAEVGQSKRNTVDTMPECVTCMCTVEGSSELHRLESCGHCVCLTCFHHQLGAEVEARQFPITCASEACGCPWSWKDINAALKIGGTTSERLVERALDALVSTSQDKFKFCPSPNCPVAYEVTSDPDGCEFSCPSCHAVLCSSCNTAYHGGLTCKQASSVICKDTSLLKWREENSDRCKFCPGCADPVEKKGGCHTMHCRCGACFCWLCLQKFEDDQDCYRHLRNVHGGIS